MDKEVFGQSQLTGFENKAPDYANVVNTVVLSTVDLLNHKSILYDSEHLKEKLTNLKIIRRDGVNHEYDGNSNSIFLSFCDQEGKLYDDEKMTITTIHELMHMISHPKEADNFGDDYFGFNEFFTEYLTFLTVMKLGGINLESYYKHEVKGYCGNNIDINIIKNLSNKAGFNKLLNCYINRDESALQELVGKETLEAMNDYCGCIIDFAETTSWPIKKINEMLEKPLFAPQKQAIDSFVGKINQGISTQRN
ncbi:MAG TPA: hypothetical protein PK370_03610 [Candidatus Woesebacteria bacterium]|nr:hypothetical protein [Candidatus Woesebacteria bacterium]